MINKHHMIHVQEKTHNHDDKGQSRFFNLPKYDQFLVHAILLTAEGKNSLFYKIWGLRWGGINIRIQNHQLFVTLCYFPDKDRHFSKTFVAGQYYMTVLYKF